MARVDIIFKFPDLKGNFKKYRDKSGMFIAAQLQRNRRKIFDTAGTYNGRRGWVPLAIRYGDPLVNKGKLRDSIGPENNGLVPKASRGSIIRLSGNVVTIGTNLIQARIQNDGGIIHAKNVSALRFPDGKGGFIFAKSVRIPARRFDNVTAQDRKELSLAVGNMIVRCLNGKN